MQIKDGRLIEIQNLYYGGYLDFEQIEKINKVLYVLAKHMFVDKKMLNKFCKEKIQVSYLKKASKHNMITIIKNKAKTEDYYYQLGVGGYVILNSAFKQVNQLNVMANLRDRQKILAMNRFIDKRGFSLLYSLLHDQEYNYFFCKEDVIVYHDKDISYNQIIRHLLATLIKERTEGVIIRYTKTELEDKYRFIGMDEEFCDIDSKAKRDDEKEE